MEKYPLEIKYSFDFITQEFPKWNESKKNKTSALRYLL